VKRAAALARAASLLAEAAKVLAEAALAEEPAPDADRDTYDSKHLPPDASLDRFHRIVRDVPRAVKIGRVWRVPRAAWEEHRRTGAGERPAPAPVANDVDTAAAAMMTGLRATRRR
jgi:hypothetical protein